MNETRSTTVEILGREYKIKGVADESYIQSVARYVDEKMREVSQATALPSQDRLAILAALNIADELFQYRQESAQSFSSIERKAANLISMIDDGMRAED
jgi:cell division protein ZapA